MGDPGAPSPGFDAAPLPEIEIVDEDPPEGWWDAAQVGIRDMEAGRFVVCDPETFDRLLSAAPIAEAS
ncbi:hypothetical protein [Frankia gtarii]|uniref:hypothetical protein n=1 Tax=Frankia gtarii TaxID=2950102 RepID=UPI0021BE0BCB|nr:hypothetical protein [Frankia gtarii]